MFRKGIVLFFAAFLWIHLGSHAYPAPHNKKRLLPPGVSLKADQRRPFKIGIPIGTLSQGEDEELTLVLKARFQQYNPSPKNKNDRFDPDIVSPKSVKFSPDGSKVYVNSLEGCETIMYDSKTLEKEATILHRFETDQKDIFSSSAPFNYKYQRARPNVFSGKPVEMEFTHAGKYLWISYYRRSYDEHGLGPSAVAVVDTDENRIVRVFGSGPIPKYLAASPDGRWLAMIHWGDNTVGFVDISSSSPHGFFLSHAVTVEYQYAPKTKKRKTKIDRDAECGYCLRGSVFTPDSRYLLIAEMSGGGGIAVIDVVKRKYLGMVRGIKPTPRHIILEAAAEGQTPESIYVSSNLAGTISKIRIEELLKAVRQEKNKVVKPEREVFVGKGTRTIDQSLDGRWIFAACNLESKIAAVRVKDFKVVAQVDVDSFPVGLAVSKDGSEVWVTSQGRENNGGDSVSIYQVEVKKK